MLSVTDCATRPARSFLHISHSARSRLTLSLLSSQLWVGDGRQATSGRLPSLRRAADHQAPLVMGAIAVEDLNLYLEDLLLSLQGCLGSGPPT